ncbi:hypothetical protein CVU37_05275 [candidate division BRC1 bacterium HGW-BRC1-1]|jgi:hypothetical protein|nr:MAG: hypothetical protein CVU37_05275 [candidate division BRC1 bacterium HGW-BRC1-1]
MNRSTFGLIFGGIFTALCTASFAATPLGGLAVALSPAEDVMVAGGDNRALLIVDTAKMEVTNRAWLGVSITDLQFNKDGSQLLVQDTDGTIHQVDAKKWEVAKSEKKADQMSVSREADLVAALDADYAGQVVKILSASDLSPKGKVTLEKGQKVVALGLNASGTRLAVLLDAVTDATEPKATETPKDLKDLAADEFKLKNDGKTSQFMVFEVPEGKKIVDKKLYYSPSSSGAKIFFSGDNALLVNYSNLNATVTPEGEVTLFKFENSYNYGIGASPDQSIILTGGLSNGSYTKVEGMNQTTFTSDKLPTWPEYFKSFAVAKDGTAYGATSSFRVARIKSNGSFDKAFPLY